MKESTAVLEDNLHNHIVIKEKCLLDKKVGADICDIEKWPASWPFLPTKYT